jgi:hypothetical protein
MRRSAFWLFMLLALAARLSAQQNTADIYGTVVLPDGSAIPGVSVTLRGEVLGTQAAVTSAEGNFRFLRLVPGNYELKFELAGFKTVIRKGIRLYASKDVTLTIPMETTAIKEEVVVTAKANVVDTRRTTVGLNVTKEMIQSLPSARNPWTVLSMVPGMMMDRVDVGGAESGQQSSFHAQGSDDADTAWNVDGVNTTDLAEPGASTSYLDVNGYEELQVTVGSNDITAQTGGVQINFVSKRGGNRMGGDLHLYVEDKAWEMKQTLPQSIIDEGWGSPGINRLYQYGVNFGGPVIKDRIWFFGTWGVQDIHARTIVGDEDATWLTAGYFKLNLQHKNTSAELNIASDNKLKWGRTRLNRAQQDNGSLRDQLGPNYYLFASVQQIVGNLMLNAKGGLYRCIYQLTPRGSKVDPLTGHNLGADRVYYKYPMKLLYGSDTYFYTDRDEMSVTVDGNYFQENFLGGDHEIRFGVDYTAATTTSQTLFPNERTLNVGTYGDNTSSLGVWLMPDSMYDINYNRITLYAADTITFGRLTANIGLRFDSEGNRINETHLKGFTWYEPGSPHDGEALFPDLLGPLTVKAGKVPVRYKTLSPRLSLTYDLNGNGKDVLKLSLARYGSQVGNYLALRMFPYREVDVYWYDNGDGKPQFDELVTDSYYYSYCYDIDYSTGWKRNRYDAKFNTPLLDELTVSYEKQLGEDLAVSVSGFYKKRHNLVRAIGLMEDGSIETKDNWYYKGQVDFPDGSSVPYYQRYETPLGTYYSNYKKAYDRYLAAQFVLTKKLSNKWMADMSFIYQDWKAFRFEEETFDLTNFDYFNGGVVAPEAGGSGLEGIYVNSRWQFKLSGLYQLPWGFSATAMLTANEGYVIPYYIEFKRGSGLSWTNIYEKGKKFGDDRLPNFWMLSVGLEKTFAISENSKATIFVDGYNVTNNKTTLSVNTLIGEDKDKILRILNPGVFQFGIRVQF